MPALFWRYLRKKPQSQAAGGTRSLCDTLCVTTTGPVQRLEKHLLDGAGLRLKIDIVVKASARGRQVCGGGGCRRSAASARLRQEHAAAQCLCSSARGEDAISAEKVVIAPLHLPPTFCWLLESLLLSTGVFPAPQNLKAQTIPMKAEAIRGLSGNTPDKL